MTTPDYKAEAEDLFTKDFEPYFDGYYLQGADEKGRSHRESYPPVIAAALRRAHAAGLREAAEYARSVYGEVNTTYLNCRAEEVESQ